MSRLYVLIILFLTPFVSFSQKYKNKEASLISFNITIYPDTKDYLDKLQGHFTPYKNNKADKILGAIKEKTWAFLVDKLQSDIGMFVLPLNTFGNDFNYDVYGFPDGSITRAQKYGESKYYIKLEMFIGGELGISKSYYPKNPRDTATKTYELKEGQIQPKVTLNLTTYSDKSIVPVSKYSGIAMAKVPFDLTPYTLDGLVNADNAFEPTTIMGLINEAISELSVVILAEN